MAHKRKYRSAPNSAAASCESGLDQNAVSRIAELEHANHELQAFAYTVAHELRAPLRRINAYTQMSRERRVPPNTGEANCCMEKIQASAAAMDALIDGILALSKASHVPVRRELTGLSVLAERAIKDATAESRDRLIEWRVHPLPTVACDPDLMQQVFLNLVENAIKYTRTRARAIIEIGSLSADEQCVFVRDNGVGFDMSHACKLFRVFERLHTREKFEGTGVGLATVRRIIERHGGRVWAQSQAGEGAEFCFTLSRTPTPTA
jgi:light-regulated signal transduction histidine kinase (bacteriophytochrome)